MCWFICGQYATKHAHCLILCIPKCPKCTRWRTWSLILSSRTILTPKNRLPFSTMTESSNCLWCNTSFEVIICGHPSFTYCMMVTITRSFWDSFVSSPGHVGFSCWSITYKAHTVDKSAPRSSLSNLSSNIAGRRLRASAFAWSAVFRYSIWHLYRLRVNTHQASRLAANIGVPLVGPRSVTSHL